MPNGYIQLQARNGDSDLPLDNVDIQIKDVNQKTVASMLTDKNGETSTISLPAPDRSLSLTPTPTSLPFATYTIIANKAGFVPTELNDIQVFDGQTSLVPVHMQLSTSTNNIINTRTTPPPMAAFVTNTQGQLGTNMVLGEGGVPRNGQTVDGVPATTRVLPNVALPKNIVVHLGVPSSDAQNLSVPFVDYIKNVVSSEIYSTWPTNAIIANTHCIITFALNRIYTEWYRSRGYNFDITSNPGYDQQFIPNREIFSNISQIVDQYFNTFAIREGFKNPFFTAYCNGSTSTCKGLSQWGTVDLANSGKTPLQILQYYYTNDLTLATADFGNTTSYPGTALRQGDSNNSVRQMQEYLNRISKNYPLIPQIPVNGSFDTATKNAVLVFQKAFGLTQDGIVGKVTWDKISYLYSAVTKLSELDSEGEKLDIGNTPPTTTIKQGDSGYLVTDLQFLLDYISNFYNTIDAPKISGNFDQATTASVKQFQTQFGLTSDGIVTANVWNTLYQIYNSLHNQSTTPPPTTPPPTTPPPSTKPPYPGQLLKVGQRGANITTLQKLLNNARQKYPQLPLLATDGIFGPATKAAVIQFQRLTGLSQDGIVGPATWGKL